MPKVSESLAEISRRVMRGLVALEGDGHGGFGALEGTGHISPGETEVPVRPITSCRRGIRTSDADRR